MSQLTCAKCGQPRDKGRRICRSCYLSEKKITAKARHAVQGRYMYHLVCKACNAKYTVARKSSQFCPVCRDLRNVKPIHINEYVYNSEMSKKTGHTWEHRCIAESVVGRKLHTNEVVHHMDHNPKNNQLENLLVISRVMHIKLHRYLDDHRVIMEQSIHENFENCWNSLITPITTAWLETTGAKVIKIWEIGQSAAEPQTIRVDEEGSETMHETSHVDEDIVQTTTAVLASES